MRRLHVWDADCACAVYRASVQPLLRLLRVPWDVATMLVLPSNPSFSSISSLKRTQTPRSSPTILVNSESQSTRAREIPTISQHRRPFTTKLCARRTLRPLMLIPHMCMFALGFVQVTCILRKITPDTILSHLSLGPSNITIIPHIPFLHNRPLPSASRSPFCPGLPNSAMVRDSD